MKIGGRSPSTILCSMLQRRHYVALYNTFRKYQHPIEILSRYLLGTGEYPYSVMLKAEKKNFELTAYTKHDILTINEIFCRNDYKTDGQDNIIVDFGSNIGISAAYFLSNNIDSYAYLYEPLPLNTNRLMKNMSSFIGRFTLNEVAVDTKDGLVNFGWEETGRYGGIDANMNNRIKVRCINQSSILKEIIQKHGWIDILKIDVETREEQLVKSISLELAKKIGKIYVEFNFKQNPLIQTHIMRRYGSVTQFFNKTSLHKLN